MTPRQRECLDAIKRLTVRGVGPTYEQLRVELGVSSKSNVHRLVSALVASGRLARTAHRDRSLRVLEPAGTPDAAELRRALQALADEHARFLAMHSYEHDSAPLDAARRLLAAGAAA